MTKINYGMCPRTVISVIVVWGTLLAVSGRAGDDGQTKLTAPTAEAQRLLAQEVRNRGWIAYGARSANGDWDLFLCRPDGSHQRHLIATPDFNETAPQFSRDGRKLLYRRLLRSESIDGNRYGEQGELVMANSDGTAPKALGKPGEFPWASWSADGQQIACLSITGICFVDLASRQVVRTLERKGFFQQLTWSPDGHWLCGVANAYGVSWSIARMDATSGAASAVNRVDCCTPDWFPDSRNLVFSWRPPGQKANNGYGWTQLWMADAEGQTRRLLYGEDGRHIYGGNISPDGQYLLFTGNMQENGDPAHAGAPMQLMRVKDAPIIRGATTELRALHPEAKDGPLLTLPVGWEPCWTFSEKPAGGMAQADLPANRTPLASAAPATGTLNRESVFEKSFAGSTGDSPVPSGDSLDGTRATVRTENTGVFAKSLWPVPVGGSPSGAGESPALPILKPGSEGEVARLAGELHDKGWLVFSAKTESGDWDLFLMRPDGSARRRITDTREFNEAGARFSADGKRLLYYRMPKSEPVDNNTYGTFALVIADADGNHPVVFGNGFQWASWSPDGTQLACLAPKGIQIMDVASRKLVRELPRKGVVQQLVWSPDGQRFVGTANGLGPFWNIGRLNPDTGELNAVSETERYNCTPDWWPDSKHIIYSRGIIPQVSGRAELWAAAGDGQEKHMLCAEEGRHLYGGCVSPDGRYLLFTRSMEDLGKVDNSKTSLAIIRSTDTPMVGDESESLRKRFPNSRSGPRLDLGWGWEPHWTYAAFASEKQGERAPINGNAGQGLKQ